MKTEIQSEAQVAAAPLAGSRQIDILLAKYSESHLNPTNEWIHIFCVPTIVFTALGLFWSISPLVALAVALASLAYYLHLSPAFAVGMLLMSSSMLGLLYLIPPHLVLKISLSVFVLAWIGQFIGHKIEGKKPSFLEDLRFLLIGPLFVLGFLYRRLGLRY